MEQRDIQSRTNQLYDAAAATYEDQPGHGFASLAEQQAWEADLRASFTIPVGAPVLDIGTGTGVFARLFASWGCQVIGFDPSRQMLAEASGVYRQRCGVRSPSSPAIRCAMEHCSLPTPSPRS